MRIVLILLFSSLSYAYAQPSSSSIAQLQSHLKTAGWYRGPVDGDWSKRLQRNLDRFKAKDSLYQQLVRPFAKEASPAATEEEALQRHINAIGQSMSKARRGLQDLKHPLARLFEAYTYYAGSVRTENQRRIVNGLVAEALIQAFPDSKTTPSSNIALPFEGSVESIEELLQLVREVNGQMGQPIYYPCWLFKKETEAILTVLAQPSTDDLSRIPHGCAHFLHDFPLLAGTYRLCNRVAVAETSSATASTETLLCRSRQIALYLNPQLPSPAQQADLEAWNQALPAVWERWAEQEKATLAESQSLAVIYSLTQLRLEKYFQEQGFETANARLLALAVLEATLCRFFEAA